jgi:hypothetical protein
MMALSFKRLRALVRKEWIQVTRDALTLRFIILVPVLQLFGSASPSTPTPRTCRPACCRRTIPNTSAR